MSKNTGGPAFPAMRYEFGGEDDGMTLRDYFAAKAMQGLLMRGDEFSVAKTAYTMADAMIAEREKE